MHNLPWSLNYYKAMHGHLIPGLADSWRNNFAQLVSRKRKKILLNAICFLVSEPFFLGPLVPKIESGGQNKKEMRSYIPFLRVFSLHQSIPFSLSGVFSLHRSIRHAKNNWPWPNIGVIKEWASDTVSCVFPIHVKGTRSCFIKWPQKSGGTTYQSMHICLWLWSNKIKSLICYAVFTQSVLYKGQGVSYFYIVEIVIRILIKKQFLLHWNGLSKIPLHLKGHTP